MTYKLAVVAVGGNSLIENPKHPELIYQWDTVRQTCRELAQMVADGWHLVITHGNGPQVGYNLERVERGIENGLHTVPLDMLGAGTQGEIGYMLQQAMDNSLRRLGINRSVLSLITQVRVERDDPAFDNPTKPIGKYLTESEAKHLRERGWRIIADGNRGWRRVVASPLPQEIIEITPIRQLVDRGHIVIACGGGGIPVIRNERGSLRGVECVIDKDRASGLLAHSLYADLLLISTGVEQVALNFETEEAQSIGEITLNEAERYILEGHFAKGSMRPKVEASMRFIQIGGPRAIITNPPNLRRAVAGETGTHIIS